MRVVHGTRHKKEVRIYNIRLKVYYVCTREDVIAFSLIAFFLNSTLLLARCFLFVILIYLYADNLQMISIVFVFVSFWKTISIEIEWMNEWINEIKIENVYVKYRSEAKRELDISRYAWLNFKSSRFKIYCSYENLLRIFSNFN